MKIHTTECSCQPDEEYADGNVPFFYTDQQKAAYMWKKLKAKGEAGQEKVWNGVELPNLRDYNLYFGVHLNGLHILTIV